MIYYDIPAVCSKMSALEEFSHQVAREETKKSVRVYKNSRRSQEDTCQNMSPRRRLSNYTRLLAIFLIIMMLSVNSVSGKCYTTKHGLTIPGAEYRKEYELSFAQCGRACFSDVSCMAFEWSRDTEECTFKARSLNGTFVEKAGVNFGLCLDKADPENMRDLFYDHEFSGVEFASTPAIPQDACSDFCLENAKPGTNLGHLSWTWRPVDPKDVDADEGTCMCTETLHHVKLHFGSISGYLK